MTLNQIRALVAVADAGTFGAAALDLGISQGAVSQSIASLERELGVRLFDRGRDGAQPTDVGRRALAHARQVLRLETALQEEASLEQGELEAQLRVEAFPSVLTNILPSVLAHLSRAHPKLELELRQPVFDPSVHPSIGTVRSLVEGSVDAGFLQLPLGDGGSTDDVLVWTLLEEAYVAVLSREFESALCDMGCLDLTILDDVPLALDTSVACAGIVLSYLSERRGTSKAQFRVDDPAMIQLAAQGAAVGIMPETAARNLPDDVVRLELRDPPVRKIAVAVAPSSLKVPAVRVFLDGLARSYPDAGLPPAPNPGASRIAAKS